MPSKEILDKKIKEEVTSGVQTLQYQINTLMTTNGRSPLVFVIYVFKRR